MNKNNKTIAFVVIIILIVAGLSFINGTKPEMGEIRFGAVLPMTGFGDLGEKMSQGATLAVNEINKQGGVLGKKIVLDIQDDGCDPKTGVNAIKKLVDIDKVNIVVGPLCSGVVSSIAPYTEENGVLLMHGGIAPSLRAIGEYVFRPVPGAEIIATQQADFAFHEINISDYVVISVNSDFGIGYSNSFVNEIKKLGGSIIASEIYVPGTTDFRSILTKVKSDTFNGLLLVGSPKEMGLMAKQAQDLGINKQIFLPTSAESQDIITTGGSSIENAIYPYGFDPENLSSQEQKNFVKNYKSEYNQESSWYSAVGYDAVKIYAEAIKLCGNTSSSCLKDKIHNLDYSGAQGNIKFDSVGDALLPLIFKTIKNGQFVSYK